MTDDIKNEARETPFNGAELSAATPTAGVDCKEYPVAEFIELCGDDCPPAWMTLQNKKTSDQLRHGVDMSFLMEDRFEVERQQFFSELTKRFGKVETEEDVENLMALAHTMPEAGVIFRSTAPGAHKASEDYIKSQEINGHLEAVGIPNRMISPSMREHMNLCHAYGCRVAGEKEGGKHFAEQLSGVKDWLQRGLGDRRTTLALTGGMLGMTVLAGTGPIGVAISGVKFGHQLLKTERGQEFQQSFFSACKRFLEQIGVPTEPLEKAGKVITDAWDRTAGTKWGATALVGVGVVVSVGAVGALSLSNIHDIVQDGRLSWSNPFEGLDSASPAAASAPDVSVIPPTEDYASQLGLTESVQGKEGSCYVDIHFQGDEYRVETPCQPEIVAEAPSTLQTGELPSPGLATPPLCDVQAGDTLWEIAERHYSAAHPGVEPSPIELTNMVNDIAASNGIENPNLIFEGQTLVLPTDIHPDKQVIVGRIDWLQNAEPGFSQEELAESNYGLQAMLNNSADSASPYSPEHPHAIPASTEAPSRAPTAQEIFDKWIAERAEDRKEDIQEILAAHKSNSMSI